MVGTQDTLILHQAHAEGSFTDDTHIKNNRVKSLLCMPLIHQGRLVAVLYLENNLASGTFTTGE
ncbi:MAG: GAF domain-containing protein [Cytophagales bacterium]|nr:GAF domain-containing protein [Cytophagales bacterium]